MFLLLIILFLIPFKVVYAGPGCCSHYGGVDKTRCTTDGRQICNNLKDGKIVVSNGDSCKCNPDNYDESNLVDPSGQYGTNPYGYSSNSSNTSKEEKTVESSNDESSFIDYLGPGAIVTTIAGGAYAIGKSSGKK